VNCARCGLEVCAEHSQFQEKLSVDALHDPVNGIWATVCFQCYTTRKGYPHSMGVVRILTASFIEKRIEKVAKMLMEVNKTENRLEKIAVSIRQASSSSISSLTMGLFGSGSEIH
jgi:rabenosyn-5